jgi:CubicO group peptidase (beta-lactamase class C family)
MIRYFLNRLAVPVAVLAAFVTPLSAMAQTPASVTPEVPEDVQALRRNFLMPPQNMLLFRMADQVYLTRKVARGGDIWLLPRAEVHPDFHYQFDGADRNIDEFLRRTYTNALIIVKDGHIVFETYRNGSKADDRFIGFSMTKSITSLLIGFTLAEGRIKSLDDTIETYLPELTGGAYEGVPIRQILRMRSGIAHNENYDPRDTEVWGPGRPASGSIDNIARYVDAARTVKRTRAPGSAYEYMNLDTAVLGWLIERVSNGSSISAYMSQRLWEPLGAEADGHFLMDGQPGTGREFNAAGFSATARDWARIGAMMINDGKANGRQIVSPAWIRESTTQFGGPVRPGLGYAYQWWTTDRSDAYSARGLAGQFLYIQPSTRTVIVKLSYFPPQSDGEASKLQDESNAFFAAASAWQPSR